VSKREQLGQSFVRQSQAGEDAGFIEPLAGLEYGRAGLGERWYNSVVLWGGLSLVLTLAAMLIFSQLFFPTGAGS